MSLVYMYGTAAFLFCVAILFHEWGHVAALKKHYAGVAVWWDGKDFNVGQEWQYSALKPLDRGQVYLDGIIWGFVPLTFIVLINNWLFLAFAVLYLYGSKHDLAQLWKLRRE